MSPAMPDVYIGNQTSVACMRNMDERVSPPWRALMHEYGFRIVAKMLDEGYRNVEAARDELETWRGRRQDQWLRTDYVDVAVRANLHGALMRRPRPTRRRRRARH
jgi:hypothetical protein